MSSAKGHLFFGLLFALLFVFVASAIASNPTPLEIVLYIVICLMFALWPDVDIKSVGQRLFYSLFFLTDVYLILNQQFKIAAYFGLIIILPVLARHRGWTHSRISMVLIPLPILIYPIYAQGAINFSGLPYYLAAATGYYSHLLLDGR